MRLRGRIGTQVRFKDSPTGGKMASFSFGEHPNRAVWSYSNTLPEKPGKETIWWPVAAFDERVALLEDVEKGKEYDLTAFKRIWQETRDQGNVKTVNGFYLLSIQEVVPRRREK